MRFRVLSAALVMSAFVFAACSHTPVDPEKSAIIPTFINLKANGNANNVLSAIVTARAISAAAIAIEYGSDSPFSQSTPFMPVNGDSARVPVLGLKASQPYVMRAVAVSASGHKISSAPFSFNTQKLPDELPRVTVLTNQSPAAGFVMLGFSTSENANKYYALIIGNDGIPVWYREFPSGVVDFQKQTNGNYTAFTSTDGSPPHFYEFDNLGSITREFRAGNGRETGPHELRLLDDGYCLFGIQFQEMNLTASGGLQDARIRGTVVEYHRSVQSLLWNPFDHFQVTDTAPDVSLTVSNINPWHGNAIDIDNDGNLLISFRNSDEITKINSRTGEIIWRLGGKKNQFTFVNDPLQGFSHQHGIRRLQNGNIILFDNGNLHSPPSSRAVEYRLNELTKIAELVWEYRHEPSLFGSALGFAQRLTNGNTLINYGTAQRVIEVDRAGTKRWELAIFGTQVFVYRAFRIDSLH
ncbi:MAG: aryl-sulfate sulfotransferase [bacterium]